MRCSLQCFVMKNGQVFNFNTNSGISHCSKAQHLSYAENKPEGYRIAFPEF